MSELSPSPTAEARSENTQTSATAVLSGHTQTRTVVTPGMAAIRIVEPGGLKLKHLFLASTLSLVVVLAVVLTVVQTLSLRNEFNKVATGFSDRIQAQARELGMTLSHTLSLTTASALRDSNYGFLGEVGSEIIDNNPNVLRVQVLGPEGSVVADTDKAVELGTVVDRPRETRWSVGAYQGQPVYEYQQPIDFGSMNGKGLVVLSYSLLALQAQLRELEATRADALRMMLYQSVAFGGGFALLAVVVAAFLGGRITRPISALSASAMSLAEGNLEARVSPSGNAGREVHALGTVFNHMADRISWLLEDARVKAVLEREVSLAKQVQEALLPTRDPFQVGGLRIAGAVVTADACGGDWWLRAALPDGRVVVGIGDVTGHGLSTALVATSATSGFASAITLGHGAQVNTEFLMSSLNRTLHQVGRGEYQMSTAMALINMQTGDVEYASGAHPNAIVINRKSGQVSSMQVRGALLGASAASTYTAKHRPLEPGDVIVWFTDGLVEAENTSRQQYGSQRLLKCLKANANLTCDRLRDALLFDVRQHMTTQPQSDDITVIVAEYNPDSSVVQA